MGDPLDDFIEALIDGSDDEKVIDATRKEVDAIVCQYGGDCYECGPVWPDYVPFNRFKRKVGE